MVWDDKNRGRFRIKVDVIFNFIIFISSDEIHELHPEYP